MNESKTKLLLFKPINKLNSILYHINQNESLQTLAKSITCVSVEIDKTLSWNVGSTIWYQIYQTSVSKLKDFKSVIKFNILKLIYLYCNYKLQLKIKHIFTAKEFVNPYNQINITLPTQSLKKAACCWN